MGATYQPTQWLIPDNANTDKVGNYSFEFDGTADYIDCGIISALNGASTFTISTWVNADVLTASTDYVFFSVATDTTHRLHIEFYGTTIRVNVSNGVSQAYQD